MYCTKCGKQSLDNEGQFCAYCGRPLVNEIKANSNSVNSVSQSTTKDHPSGFLWPIILLCTRSVMWAIAAIMFMAISPAISTWNIVWTIFGFYVIYKIYKRNVRWYNSALCITGVDAVWLLFSFFSTANIHQLFLYISIIDIITFVLLLVNKKYFINVAK
ncbi:MAG: zinc ribbon domain-containing protein [Christensenellales bacterium]|jgi:ribosomal protein L37E